MAGKKLIEGKDYIVPKPESKKQEMILNNDAQVLVIGGAMGGGKTYLQQLIALRYIDDPNTRIVTFRRTTSEITGQGGVYETAKDIYENLHPKIRPRFVDGKLKAIFPSGATCVYKHMQHVEDRKKNQGLQFTICNFDEGTLFEWIQIEYMFQRMRSKSKYKSRIIISTNPDPDHEIAKLVNWYLDEEGFPDPEKEGVIRYFIRRNGEFEWGATREELGEKFNIPKEHWDSRILSFSFIGCTIYDNPPNMEANPEYLAFLEGMPEVDKARNLYGNWYARPEGANYFKRDWLKKSNTLPLKAKIVRAWDKAGTEPSDVNKYPDFTASVQMYKDRDGNYYIAGNYCPSNFDKTDPDIKGRFRRRAGDRDKIILDQARYDGNDCYVILPQDPGSAGIMEFQESAKKLIEEGFVVKKDPMPSSRSKLVRFTPFASACENGLVTIIENTFDSKTLEHFYKELESFDGERSTSARKDDLVDATASAFNYLSKQKVLPSFSLNTNNSNNKIASVKQSVFATK